MSTPNKAPKPFPFDAEHLKSILHYDPETGHFTWRINRWRHLKAGVRAGFDNGGYWAVRYDGRNYLAHRLAWLYMHGVEPESLIDHINRNGMDNRFCNLREATPLQNTWNANPRPRGVAGYRGVRAVPGGGRWIALCRVERVVKHLGTFNSPEDASAAYQAFVKANRGEYAA